MEEIYKLIIICPLIFIASVIDAIVGSGSVISFPTYLVAGLPAHYAYGTQRFVTFWGALVSALRYIHNKKYELKIVIIFAILCMIGTYIGSKLILSINETYLRYILIILIVVFFIFSTVSKHLKSKKTNIENEEIKQPKILSTRKKLILSLIFGMIIGLYSGTIGIGITSILIMIFIKIFHIDEVKASGTARIILCLLNFVAMITFMLDKKVIFSIAIPATISSMLGNYVGAGLAMKKTKKIMEPLLKVIFVVLFIELIIGTIF